MKTLFAAVAVISIILGAIACSHRAPQALISGPDQGGASTVGPVRVLEFEPETIVAHAQDDADVAG